MDLTSKSLAQTKTYTMLQSLHVLPYTYYYEYRIEPKNYVYRPNNRLVLAIT
jgi:hypothetical protein